jgi:hypothetical protein
LRSEPAKKWYSIWVDGETKPKVGLGVRYEPPGKSALGSCDASGDVVVPDGGEAVPYGREGDVGELREEVYIVSIKVGQTTVNIYA